MPSFFRQLRTRFLKWTESDPGLPIQQLMPLERLGSTYGGWIIPADWLDATSVCYLVGAGEDVSFDLAVADRYRCAVHIFDPTPRAIRHIDMLRENIEAGELTDCTTCPTGYYPEYHPMVAKRLFLHSYGIWSENTNLRFYAPLDDNNVSHSIVNLQQNDHFIEVPVKRLSNVMKSLGHTRLDLLKLDIEGAEYEVLNSMLEDKLEIDVLCIEFDETAAHHFDSNYTQRIRAALEKLVQTGFHIVAKDSPANNYTLVHDRLAQKL